jgi:hypothetical protein
MRKPFQFTIRSLLLLMLLVALFCAMATSLGGTWRLFALTGFVWLAFGGLYVKHRAYRAMLLPHCAGPGLLLAVLLPTAPAWIDPAFVQAALVPAVSFGFALGCLLSTALAGSFWLDDET